MSTLLKLIPELKNVIINGNFDWWQRGLTISVNGFKYLADRFGQFNSATYTIAYSRSTDVPTQAQSGFNSLYSMLLTNGTGSAPGVGDFSYIDYRVEGQDYQPLHGKPVRLQFWVKSSIAGTYSVNFQNSAGNRTYVVPYTISSANTWERKSVDVVLDSSGTWLFDNTVGLHVSWGTGGGTNYQTSTLNAWQSAGTVVANTQTQWVATTGATFQLAQVALYPIQAGTGIILPFVRHGRDISDELRACQRYYETPNPTGVLVTTNSDYRFLGSAYTGSTIYYMGQFVVSKRIDTWTGVISDSGAFPPFVVNSSVIGTTTAAGFEAKFYNGWRGNIGLSSAAATVGQSGLVRCNWTVDAEL